MARRGGTQRTLEEELAELAAVGDAPRSPESAARLRLALSSKRARVVARAASLVMKHSVDGFLEPLVDAFDRFVEHGAKTDPGCVAKAALAEALDGLEWSDTAFFLRAARLTQPEPVWGGQEDTAGGVRVRGLLALARLSYPDFALEAARAATDPRAEVRVAAADGLACFGVRHGAGVVLLALERPEEDPLVTLALMSALLALAPELGLERLAPSLTGEDLSRAELAALALGQSQRSDAAQALVAALEQAALPKARVPLYNGLGQHRSELALTTLLGVVAERPLGDAKAALRALAPRRFDPGVRERMDSAVRGARAEGLAPELALVLAEK